MVPLRDPWLVCGISFIKRSVINALSGNLISVPENRIVNIQEHHCSKLLLNHHLFEWKYLYAEKYVQEEEQGL